MQWLKWTMLIAVGCLPALALADEPAKKDKDKDDVPKIGLRIEVQFGDQSSPKVLVFGDGDNKEPKELAKRLEGLVKRMQVKAAEAKADNKPPLEPANVRQLTDELARKATTLTLWRQTGEKGTFLGVGTSEPPAVLSRQLGLHDGMGLVVDQVVPDGPAAKAGVKEYDVLEKFDDQLVINFEQLAVLVHSHKPGDEVKLTVIHEGKPAVLTAKLTEHELRVGMWDAPYEFKAHVANMQREPRVWEIVTEEKFTHEDKTKHEDKVEQGKK